MWGFLLALLALIIGIALWAGVNLGKLQADAIPIAIIALALAMLIGPAITFISHRAGPSQ